MENLNYNYQDLDQEINIPDLKKSIDEGVMHGIVSEADGGIIAYAIGNEHADEIVAKLNEYDRIKEILKRSGMWDELYVQL
jgi:hypothetical protein